MKTEIVCIGTDWIKFTRSYSGFIKSLAKKTDSGINIDLCAKFLEIPSGEADEKPTFYIGKEDIGNIKRWKKVSKPLSCYSSKKYRAWAFDLDNRERMGIRLVDMKTGFISVIMYYLLWEKYKIKEPITYE
jgi:hypothetical protein